MSAQFFSSLADQALFVAAVELIKTAAAPEWQRAALVPIFALFYVVLAPWLGAFADARPKGNVMFISNAIKVVGCLMMLFGSHPLLAYAVVGLGAAAYSPAKYGILTELLPASQLVKANGWIEGLTIASIILGILLGGQLVGHAISSRMLAIDLPFLDTGIDTRAGSSHLRADLHLRGGGLVQHCASRSPASRCGRCRRTRWSWCPTSGPATRACGATSWGRSRWPPPRCSGASAATCATSSWPGARAALGYSTTQASSLGGVVAIGTAVGAIVASMRMRLDVATQVIPHGHHHGRPDHRDELHRQRLGGRAVPDPDGRAGRLPGGADERAAAAPGPQPDGRRAAPSPCRTSTSRPASWAWARSTACPPAWACRPSAPSPRSGWWWPASCG